MGKELFLGFMSYLKLLPTIPMTSQTSQEVVLEVPSTMGPKHITANTSAMYHSLGVTCKSLSTGWSQQQ